MNGFTGAEIAFVAREGAYNCLRRTADVGGLIKIKDSKIELNQYSINKADFEKALLSLIANHNEGLSES